MSTIVVEYSATEVDSERQLWLTSSMDQEITKEDALALYGGNGAALGRALNVSRQAVNKTPAGPLPEKWQLKLRYEIHPGVWPNQQEAA